MLAAFQATGFFTEAHRAEPLCFVRKGFQPWWRSSKLRETWNDPKGGPLKTCTIIATTLNAVTAPIHDRMPVMSAEMSR